MSFEEKSTANFVFSFLFNVALGHFIEIYNKWALFLARNNISILYSCLKSYQITKVFPISEINSHSYLFSRHHFHIRGVVNSCIFELWFFIEWLFHHVFIVVADPLFMALFLNYTFWIYSSTLKKEIHGCLRCEIVLKAWIESFDWVNISVTVSSIAPLV